MIARSPLPAEDLRTAVRWALWREAALFSAGEVVVLGRLLALSEDAAELFARLSLRVGPVFRVATLDYACATPEALAELHERGLVVGGVPDSLALPAFTAEVLREACRRLGLPVGGARAVLEARLLGRLWREEPVVLVLHRGLLARVERLGGFDRSLAPVERIQGTVWAEYAPTPGTGPFANRQALLTWERARRGELTPEEAQAIAERGPAPWGRSPWKYAVEAVLTAAPSADTLARIPGCELPLVRALEAEGRLAEAVAVCRAGSADPEVALALGRTGRRLAKRLQLGWAPADPLQEAAVRRLWMRRAPSDERRPLWLATDVMEGLPVEAACLQRVAEAGRRALHSENWLWTSLFALVFRSLYWLPVPGTLPTLKRSGPLDLGTPSFYAARREPADALLAVLREKGVAPFFAAWGGERLDGLVNPELAAEVGSQLEGPLVAAVLERILRLGWAAARGLPDLLVLPGAGESLFHTIPGVLPDGAFFAEIKGPGDTLREGQRLWIDSLVWSGIRVEIWHVSDTKVL